jgi:hypothetical protein
MDAGNGVPKKPMFRISPVPTSVVRAPMIGRASALPVAITSGDAPYMFGMYGVGPSLPLELTQTTPARMTLPVICA